MTLNIEDQSLLIVAIGGGIETFHGTTIPHLSLALCVYALLLFAHRALLSSNEI
jgi:hypothetical protein